MSESETNTGQPRDKAYQKAEFSALDARPAEGSGGINLDLLLDVPVNLTLEVGRTRMSLRDLLELTQGSVLELDRLAGEPLDLLVNGTLIARGEVVVVNENFGLRLTDIVSPEERVKKARK